MIKPPADNPRSAAPVVRDQCFNIVTNWAETMADCRRVAVTNDNADKKSRPDDKTT